MKNPAERCNAGGVEIAATLSKGNRMAHSTVSTADAEAAFVAGYSAYPFTFETGRRAAQLWLTAKNPPLSLADFRDSRWRAHSCGRHCGWQEQEAFNQGFSRALAEHIAGGGIHG